MQVFYQKYDLFLVFLHIMKIIMIGAGNLATNLAAALLDAGHDTGEKFHSHEVCAGENEEQNQRRACRNEPDCERADQVQTGENEKRGDFPFPFEFLRECFRHAGVLHTERQIGGKRLESAPVCRELQCSIRCRRSPSRSVFRLRRFLALWRALARKRRR